MRSRFSRIAEDKAALLVKGNFRAQGGEPLSYQPEPGGVAGLFRRGESGRKPERRQRPVVKNGENLCAAENPVGIRLVIDLAETGDPGSYFRDRERTDAVWVFFSLFYNCQPGQGLSPRLEQAGGQQSYCPETGLRLTAPTKGGARPIAAPNTESSLTP